MVGQPSESNEPKAEAPVNLLPQLELSLEKKEELAQISLHALTGRPIPHTLCILGLIRTSPVYVLVNGGSTRKFIQDRVVRFLGLTMESTNDFRVLARNGTEIPCSYVCQKVPVKIHEHIFEVDLYVMPLSGADVVLGVHWLLQLGLMLTNYAILTMKFIKNRKIVQHASERFP